MPTFDGFETVGEPRRRGLRCTWDARPAGSNAAPRLQLRSLCTDDPALAPDPAHLRAEADRIVELGSLLETLHKQGARHWAVPVKTGQCEGRPFVVIESCPWSAQFLVETRVAQTPASLGRILLGVVDGLLELERLADRAHGNLQPASVLLAGQGSLARVRVRLSDPAPAGEATAQADLHALGRLLYQLVRHRPAPPGGRIAAEDPEPWRALGPNGDAWQALCQRLLTAPADGSLTLGQVRASLQALTARKRRLWPLAAAVVLLAAGAGAFPGLWRPGPKTQWAEVEGLWPGLVSHWAGWFKPVYDDLAYDGTTRRNWQTHEPLRDALASLEGTANEGADPRFIEKVNKRGDSPDILIKNPPEEARQNPDPIGPTLAAMTAFHENLLGWLESQAALYDARGWATAAGEVRSHKDLFAAGTTPQAGLSAATIADWAEQMAQAEQAWQRVEAACTGIAGLTDDFGKTLRLDLQDEIGQTLASLPLHQLTRAAEDCAKDAEAIQAAAEPLALRYKAVRQAVSELKLHRLDPLGEWLVDALADKSLAELPPTLQAMAGPQGPLQRLSQCLTEGRDLYAFDRFTQEPNGEPSLSEPMGLADVDSWLKELDRFRFVPESEDPRECLADLQTVETEIKEYTSYPDHDVGLLESLKERLSGLTAEEARLRALPRAIAADLETLKQDVTRQNSQAGTLSADVQKALAGVEAKPDFAIWLKDHRDYHPEPVVLDGRWQWYLDSLEEAQESAAKPGGKRFYTMDLQRRVAQARALLGRLGGDLPEPPETLVKPALTALGRVREGRLRSLAETLLPIGQLPMTQETFDPLVAKNQREYEGQCRETEKLLAGVQEVGEALAALDLDKALEAYAALPDLRPTWLQTAEWDRLVESTTEPMAMLEEILQESSFAKLVERVDSGGPAYAVWTAWRRLGQLEDWPATEEHLEQELDMRPVVTSALQTVNGARRAELESQVATELAGRWQKCLARAASDESMAVILDLRSAFGVTDDQLLPWAEFSLRLRDLRARADGPRVDDDAVGQAILDFQAFARRLKLPGTEWVEELPNPSNRPTPLPLDQCGPASQGGLGAWRVEESSDGLTVAYTCRIGKESHTLAFRRVDVDGQSVYLGTTEVSVGLVEDLSKALGSAHPLFRLLKACNNNSDYECRWQPPIGVRTWLWDDTWGLKRSPLFLAIVTTERDVPYYPDESVRSDPQPDHPVQQVSPQAAACLAAALGCRLPTQAEWLNGAAMEKWSTDLSHWNLRDAAWVAQRKHRASQPGAFLPSWPDDGIFLRDEWPAKRKADAEPAVLGNDRTLWFDAVGQRGDVFHGLIGNVWEYVIDDAQAEAANALVTKEGDELKNAVAALADGVSVIGLSALSPPGLEWNKAYPVSGVKNAAFGFADVGLRLAFQAPGKTLQVQLREALAGKPYQGPAGPLAISGAGEP